MTRKELIEKLSSMPPGTEDLEVYFLNPYDKIFAVNTAETSIIPEDCEWDDDCYEEPEGDNDPRINCILIS